MADGVAGREGSEVAGSAADVPRMNGPVDPTAVIGLCCRSITPGHAPASMPSRVSAGAFLFLPGSVAVNAYDPRETTSQRHQRGECDAHGREWRFDRWKQ
jgi:hypothetical protein